MTEKLTILPDTNILLHFEAFTGGGWLKALGVKSLTILIIDCVMQEIDRLKNGTTNEVLRERARAVSRWLAPAVERVAASGQPTEIGKNIFIDLLESPTLTEGQPADELIINHLRYQRRNDQLPQLMTDDSHLRIKAIRLKLPCIMPPEDLRKADQPSPTEKKLKAAEAQIELMNSKLPKLVLEHEISVCGYAGKWDAVDRMIARGQNFLEAQVSVMPKEGYASESELKFALNYNSRAEWYLEQLPKYLSELRSYFLTKAACRKVQFRVRNNGNAPADHLILYVNVTPRVLLLTESSLHAKVPYSILREVPRHPRMTFHNCARPRRDFQDFMSFWKSLESGPHLVRRELGLLLHHQLLTLDPLFVIDDELLTRNLSLDYSLITASHPEKLQGTIEVPALKLS